MDERNRARPRSGFRRSRRFRGDRRGVVAVVGTLLALLVFFALFGVFLTQYVPLWMEENESQLSNRIQTSLSTLKSGVDDQYLLGGIPAYSVPFTMNSQSVPLLTQPTVATLSYLAGCPGGFYTSNGTPEEIAACDFEHLSYTTGAGGTGSQNYPYAQTVDTKYLEVTLPDRYYTPVTYFFESDGVAEVQSSSQQWMLVPPPFNVSRSAGVVTVDSSLITLVGNASSFTGQGSKDVTSQFLTSANVSSTDRFLTSTGSPRTFNVTLTLGVHAVCAWYNFLYNETYDAFASTSSTYWTLAITGAKGAVTPPLTVSVCDASVSTTYDLTLKIFNVNHAFSYVVQDQLSFNAGGL